MSVITFATSKGGAGKTTSAIILGTTLARKMRVTMIDADPAARLMSWASKAELPPELQITASKGERHIHDEIEQAREVAPGWDVRAIEHEWRVWLGDNDVQPRAPEAHFLKFCRSWFERRGRPE